VAPKSADFSRYRCSTTICPYLGEIAVAVHGDALELLAELSPEISLHSEDKVVTCEELVHWVVLWRRTMASVNARACWPRWLPWMRWWCSTSQRRWR
jgi:hypothetical protein